MRSIVLDTNAYTHYLRSDERMLQWLAQADVVYVPVVVLGELYVGFKGGSKEKENRRFLERFLSKNTVEVLDITAETAEVFGHLKHLLKEAETPIPVNDVWIASSSFETGSILVSYDGHFKKIPGLRLWEYL
jgi:tRNA(fMet)-specific endonuclease VapC